MDLWIRSQDRLTTLKVNKDIKIIDYRGLNEKLKNSVFSFLGEMEQMEEYLNKDGWGLSCDETCLGIYETKERALEVLDEIQRYMLNGSFAKITNGLGEIIELKPNPIFVYEMPKE